MGLLSASRYLDVDICATDLSWGIHIRVVAESDTLRLYELTVSDLGTQHWHIDKPKVVELLFRYMMSAIVCLAIHVGHAVWFYCLYLWCFRSDLLIQLIVYTPCQFLITALTIHLSVDV